MVEHLVRALRIADAPVRADERAPWQPGLCAALGRFGHFGVVHPDVCVRFDMEGRRIVAGEFDLDALLDAASATFKTTAPPRFPALPIDVSMFVPRSVPAADVVAAVHGARDARVHSVEVIDEFTGAQVPEGTRSLTIRLTLLAADRSLTVAEAAEVRTLVGARLRAQVHAQVRE